MVILCELCSVVSWCLLPCLVSVCWLFIDSGDAFSPPISFRIRPHSSSLMWLISWVAISLLVRNCVLIYCAHLPMSCVVFCVYAPSSFFRGVFVCYCVVFGVLIFPDWFRSVSPADFRSCLVSCASLRFAHVRCKAHISPRSVNLLSIAFFFFFLGFAGIVFVRFVDMGFYW